MEIPNNIIDIKSQIPEIKVHLPYATEDNFTGTILPGYFNHIAYLTIEACEKLKLAHNEAKKFGLNFLIYDSYRPTDAVNFFYETWRLMPEDAQLKKRFYPNLSKEELFKIGYVATHSSHSRASTIDLTLINSINDRPLDMGTEFDFFGTQSHTDFPRLSLEQRTNRLLLKSLMEKYNFINYQNEWWHFRLINEPYPSQTFNFSIKMTSPP